ncbi:MAG: tetratricopeptide repeat protein, partial [Planctomycetes bacterium]|nr:tetratricopeptide repeat protein [Planctomycetota bacterium]
MSRLRELFDAATQLGAAERSALLARECAADAPLREQVEELLRLDDASGFLDEDRLRRLGLDAEEPLPAAIGPYRVLGLLGRGGMGVVYRAEQPEPRREVAVKVLAAGAGGSAGQSRMLQEARALGRLQHPGIAQIHAADTWLLPHGAQPFLVMELVRGETLAAWAMRTRPGVAERVRLLAAIADAVQHAHHRGVVHRDLKPGNVMVDERGQPKVLDFGIARLLAIESEAAASATATVAGQLLGTLSYMSPEQANGETSAIDGRSDVYALGAIGYQMLAGVLPIDVTTDPITRGLQRVAAETPPPLGRFDPRFRGDLETIFATALQKDPERRYASMAAFADDLRRHLAHQPIAARPATFGYVASRFVRRHALGLLAGASVFLGLAVALLVSLQAKAEVETALVAEGRARREAEESAAVARREEQLKGDVLAVLGEVFGTVDPSRTPGALHQPLAQRMQQALARLDERFRSSPATERRVRFELGRTLSGRGEYAAAEGELLRAQALLQDRGDDEAAQIDYELALLRGNRGDHAGALAVLEAMRLPAPTTTAGLVMAVQCDVLRAQVLGRLGRVDEVLPLLANARRRCVESTLPMPTEVLASVHANLGTELLRRGDHAAAERELVLAADGLQGVAGADAEETLTLLNSQAVLLWTQGHFQQAAELLQPLVTAWEHTYGPDHPTLCALLQNLGAAKARLGEIDAAIGMYERALALLERMHGPDSPELCIGLANLGALRRGQKDLPAAAALYERAIAIREQKRAEPDRELSGFLYDLAKIRRDLGDPALHLLLLERSVRVRIAALGPFHEAVLGRRVELADH